MRSLLFVELLFVLIRIQHVQRIDDIYERPTVQMSIVHMIIKLLDGTGRVFSRFLDPIMHLFAEEFDQIHFGPILGTVINQPVILELRVQTGFRENRHYEKGLAGTAVSDKKHALPFPEGAERPTRAAEIQSRRTAR